MIITNYDKTWSFMFTFFIKRYRDIQGMRPFAREEYLETNKFPRPNNPDRC